MDKLKAEVLFESLTEIDDPRREHQKFHSLFDILVIPFVRLFVGRSIGWRLKNLVKRSENGLLRF